MSRGHVAFLVAASILASACTGGGEADETPRLGELAALADGVPNPLTVACRIGVCVADQVVLPAGRFVDSAVDVPMPDALALLSLERVWLGTDGDDEDESTGIFGPGWWSWLDLGVDGGELEGPAPSMPVSPVRSNGEVSFADGSRVTWKDGAVAAACPSQGFCVDVVRDDERITLTAVDSPRSVTLELRDGVAVAATTSDGRAVTYGYAAGLLSAVEGLESSAATYAYSSQELVAVVDRLGERRVTYRGGRVTELIDRDGDTWAFAVSGPEVAPSVTVDRASGTTLVHEFESAWLTRTVDHAGNVLLERTLDEGGDLRSEHLVTEGLTTTWHPDGSSEVRRTRPEGGPDEVVHYAVDELGRVIAASGADGPVGYRYAGSSTRVASIDRGGAVTTFDYDSNGLVSTVVDPDGYRVELRRDDAGLPVSIDDGIQSQEFVYDVSGVLLEQATGSTVTSFTYSPAGDLVREQTGASERTFRYDEQGRLLEAEDAFGSETIRYDELGRVIGEGVDDANEQAVASGELTPTDQTIAGLGGAATYADGSGNLVAFDDVGRIIAVETPAGITRRAFDERGDLVELVLPDGRSYAVERSPGGRPLRITDRNGRQMELTWRNARLARVVTFAGAEVRYSWNDGGQLAGVSVGPTSWTYHYDQYGHVERVETPQGDVTFDWSPEGLPLSRTGPTGATTTFEWAEGLLQRVLDGEEELLAIDWDEADRVVAIGSEGADEAFEYDDGGRLVAHQYDGTETAYTYDDDGRIAGVQQGAVSESWTWTGSEVTEVRTGDDEDDRYDLSWFLPGQLNGIAQAGQPIVAFDYSSGGQLVAARAGDDELVPVGTLQWSANGQLLSAEIGAERAELDYDADGRVVTAETSDASFAATYRSGAIHDVTVDDTTLAFAYDDGTIATTSFQQGDVSAELTWHTGVRVTAFETSEGSGEFSYLADGRVEQIAYDDRIRPVSYDDEGRAAADGTGGEILDDLFTGDGHFALLADDAIIEPSIDALASLPSDLGIDVPGVIDPAEYLDAFLSAKLPVAPQPLVGNGNAEQIAKRAILVTVNGASVVIPTGPVTQARVSVLPDDSDALSGLLDDSAASRIANHLVDRLSPDHSILDRVTGTSRSVVAKIGSTFQSAWRFIHDNPVARAVMTLSFLVANFIALPAVVTTVLAAVALMDPDDLIGSILAIVLEPIRAVSGMVSDPNLVDALTVGVTVLAIAPWVRAAWGRHSCSLSRVVCVSRTRFGEAAAHADDAIASGQARFLTADAAEATARRRDSLRGWSRVPGRDLDEYPPAFTRQGGTGASVRAIDPCANRALGAYIRGQLPSANGYRFLVRVVA